MVWNNPSVEINIQYYYKWVLASELKWDKWRINITTFLQKWLLFFFAKGICASFKRNVTHAFVILSMVLYLGSDFFGSWMFSIFYTNKKEFDQEYFAVFRSRSRSPRRQRSYSRSPSPRSEVAQSDILVMTTRNSYTVHVCIAKSVSLLLNKR